MTLSDGLIIAGAMFLSASGVLLFQKLPPLIRKRRKREHRAEEAGEAPAEKGGTAQASSTSIVFSVVPERDGARGAGRGDISLAGARTIEYEDEQGHRISFERTDAAESTRVYRELPVGQVISAISNMSQAVIPVGQEIYTAAELARMAPGGLFTVSVNASGLTRMLKNGTGSTVVKQLDGQVITAAGFRALRGLAGINPVMITAVALKAMSAISGKYYLSQISASLMGIAEEVNGLREDLVDRDVGKLMNAEERLSRLVVHEQRNDNDTAEARDIRTEMGSLCYAYGEKCRRGETVLTSFDSGERRARKRFWEYHRKLQEYRRARWICTQATRLYILAMLSEILLTYRFSPDLTGLEDLIRDAASVYERLAQPAVRYIDTAAGQEITLNQIILRRASAGLSRRKSREWMPEITAELQELDRCAERMREILDTRTILTDVSREEHLMLCAGEDGSEPHLFIAAEPGEA